MVNQSNFVQANDEEVDKVEMNDDNPGRRVQMKIDSTVTEIFVSVVTWVLNPVWVS